MKSIVISAVGISLIGSYLAVKSTRTQVNPPSAIRLAVPVTVPTPKQKGRERPIYGVSNRLCPLHQEHLINGVGRIRGDIWNLPGGGDGFNYVKANEKLFPLSHTFLIIYCGTEVDRNNLTRKVLYCPQCRKVEAQWISQQSN